MKLSRSLKSSYVFYEKYFSYILGGNLQGLKNKIRFWKEYTKRYNFFNIFIANKIFKILFTKRDLIGYYYFLNSFIVFKNMFFILMIFLFFNSSVIELYNILFVFISGFKFFLILFFIYNFPLSFLFKSAFWTKFIIFIICVFFFLLLL